MKVLGLAQYLHFTAIFNHAVSHFSSECAVCRIGNKIKATKCMGVTKEDRGIEERRKCNRVGENVGKYKGGSKEQEQ